MSILKDLDPQYAKLHAEPSRQKPIAWIGGALLVMGCIYWITLHSPAKGTAQKTQDLEAAKAMKAEPGRESISEGEKQDSATKTPLVAAGATIREDRPRTIDTAPTRTSATPEPTRENTTRSPADSEYRSLPQTVPHQADTTPANNAPSTPKTENTKRKNPASQSTRKIEKTQVNNGRRVNERDVDIITAIVR